jgi:hypothetical protein
MAIQTNFRLMEHIADQIGAEAALRLCGFFGGRGRAVYVPVKPIPDHIIEKIIGPRAYADLCAAFPGESVPVPSIDLEPLRNAGRIWAVRDSGLSQGQLANLTGLSKQRIGQILAQLQLEGFDSLADVLSEEIEQEVRQ